MLRNRNFSLFVSGTFISLTGDWLGNIGLVPLVYGLSGDPAVALSVVFTLRILPTLIVVPLLSPLLDKVPRKDTMVFVNSLSAFVVFLVPVIPSLPVLYILIFLLFTLVAIFQPVQRSFIPTIVVQDELVQANSILSVSGNMSLILGPLAGGILGTFTDLRILFWINAITFLVAALCILLVSDKERRSSTEGIYTGPHYLREFASGVISLFRSVPTFLVGIMVLIISLNGTLNVIIYPFLKQVLEIPTEAVLQYGLVTSAVGVGTVMGASVMFLSIKRANPQRHQLIALTGLLLIGVSALLLCFARDLYLVVTGAVIFGAGTVVASIITQVAIQKTVRQQYLARVFAIWGASLNLANILGTWLGGILMKTLLVRQVVGAITTLAWVSLILASIILIRIRGAVSQRTR